jgi:hypothetical protein
MVLFVAAFWQLYFSERPPLTIDPVTVLFVIGDAEYCNRTSASMTWNNKVLECNVFDFGPIEVKRYTKGQQLVWEYTDGSTTYMDRICILPANKIISQPRGPRYQLF